MSIGAMLVFALVAHGTMRGMDLEKTAQKFVLETKQIHIPGFPGAFNACATRWKDSLLMCFRVRNEHMVSTFEIGFVWLDENFNPKSTPRILEIRDAHAEFSRAQDARLITIKNRLYMVYSNFIKIDGEATRRMFLAEIYTDETGGFFIQDPYCLDPFEGSGSRWEKNWVPFIYNGDLLLAYSLLPHRIMRPKLSGECVTVSAATAEIVWDWGELRGGTPAALDGDEYLAFFHSSKKVATTHSQGKEMPHYVMGAYTFSKDPPFTITRVSAEPIVGKKFYDGPAYNTWKPLRVVFPMGYVSDEQYIWITYGRQDFEVWVAKLDKRELYKSLVACPRKKITIRYDTSEHDETDTFSDS